MEVRNEAKKQKIWIPAEEISNNIDLLTEILLQLQVKPLIRYKCVSKQWLSLISDPQFCLSYNRHHHNPYPTPTLLLLKNSSHPTPKLEMVSLTQLQDTIPKVPLFDYLNNPCLHIFRSCNGLFLCRSESNRQYRLLGSLFLPELNYYICNPATKQFKSVSFPSFRFTRYMVSICMAFDPLQSNHYKLISFRQVRHKEKCHVDIYSSETDCWRYLGITDTEPVDVLDGDVVFCNGAVHWYTENKTSFYFDVDRECFKTMPMPNLAKPRVEYFGESRGNLHLIVNEWRLPLQFDVLEMAPDYSGWSVRYHVNLDVVGIAFPDIIWHRVGYYNDRYNVFSVVHVIRAEKEEDSIVVIFVDNRTISLNVHNGISRKLLDLEHPVTDNYSYSNNFPYLEILTSV